MLRFLHFCERRLMYLCVSSRRPTSRLGNLPRRFPARQEQQRAVAPRTRRRRRAGRHRRPGRLGAARPSRPSAENARGPCRLAGRGCTYGGPSKPQPGRPAQHDGGVRFAPAHAQPRTRRAPALNEHHEEVDAKHRRAARLRRASRRDKTELFSEPWTRNVAHRSCPIRGTTRAQNGRVSPESNILPHRQTARSTPLLRRQKT